MGRTSDLAPSASRSDASARARTGLATREIDAVKGFFLVLIALGHNALVTQSVDGMFPTLYAFHIYAFLLLPFLFPSPPLGARFAVERAVRYLVPHTVFFALSAAAFWALHRRGDPLGAVLGDVAVGWLVSSSRAYKDACGFYLYWFLPTLLTLVLVRAAFAGAGRRARALLLAALLALHPLVGALPEEAKRWIPFGLPIAAYVFPLALAGEWAWARVRAAGLARGAAFALGIGTACLVAYRLLGGFSSLAFLALESYRTPVRLALADATAVLGFVGLTALGPGFARVPGLAALGRLSLVAFLVHSLVYQCILAALPAAWTAEASRAVRIAVGLPVLAGTLAVSYAIARAVDAAPVLRAWITPRGVADWPPSAWLERPRSSRLAAPTLGAAGAVRGEPRGGRIGE